MASLGLNELNSAEQVILSNYGVLIGFLCQHYKLYMNRRKFKYDPDSNYQRQLFGRLYDKSP